MYVVTPRCAAATVVSAVVLRRQTKEYTHPYSMMHRRLPTARIEFAPHYHQLQVYRYHTSTCILVPPSFSPCTRLYCTPYRLVYVVHQYACFLCTWYQLWIDYFTIFACIYVMH